MDREAETIDFAYEPVPADGVERLLWQLIEALSRAQVTIVIE